MSSFAAFDPALLGRAPALPADLVLARAELADVPALAAVLAEREGSAPEPLAERFAAELSLASTRAGHLLLVARLGGQAVAFGRVTTFTPPADAPPRCAPGGLYLGGVVVASAVRARGIASALVRARLAWCAARGPRVHATANARNAVSLHLLARHGFRELTRDFAHPDVTFEGGRGVLLVRELAAADAVPAPSRAAPS